MTRLSLPDPDLYGKGLDSNLVAHLPYDELVAAATPGAADGTISSALRADWNPAHIRAARFACVAKLSTGSDSSMPWKSAPERLTMLKAFCKSVHFSTRTIVGANLSLPTFDVNQHHLDAAVDALIQQQYQTANVYVSFVLYMNSLGSPSQDSTFVQHFPSVQAACEFYNGQLASNPYQDGQYVKHFLKGGPLEWYNVLCDNWWDVDRTTSYSSQNQGLFERLTRNIPTHDS